MTRSAATLATLALAFSVGLIHPASAQRTHRSLFYSETPFGSLAWVRGPQTRSAARTRLTVDNLSSESCINLPASGAQWFMINHREEEHEGQVGYFSVRILYQFSTGERSANERTGIHLQRNGNWFDVSGKQSVRDYERNSEQIPLTEEAFIELHNPAAGSEEKSFANLEQAVGSWHMKPSGDDDSSWSDRYLYGPMLKAYLSGSTGAISARLIRFTITSGSSSSDPVLFWLDPRGAVSATILVDAPRQTYQGSRRVYSVSFGGTCPAQ